jgi:2-desacetyl-2-hydroxyethyl bacteriochlorophyllide A dehydrogenase
MVEATALVTQGDRSVSLGSVSLPEPTDDDVLIRTRYSGVSIGTELDIIRGSQGGGRYPVCTGYQATGVVESAGANVESLEAGDRVYFRDNRSMKSDDGEAITTGTGSHCSQSVVNPEESIGVARLPDGVDEAVASTFVLPAVGLNGVDRANVRMGDTVAVQGVGLVGLGVVAACVHRGAEVVAVDPQENRLEVAGQLGADHLVNPDERDPVAAVDDVTEEEGADVVFEATGIHALLDTAFQLCKPYGTFVFQGVYQGEPVSFDYRVPHNKHLGAVFPCDDGLEPCRRAVLKNMASGALPWEHTITHRYDAADAPDLYTDLLADEADDVIGAVIDWRGQ